MASIHKDVPTGRVRNVVLLGSGGTGKTTLAEAMLHHGGAAHGRAAVFDSEPDEVERGHSLSTATASFEWRGHRINLIDTPGAPDFVGDAYPAIAAADVAVFVIDAVEGVEAIHEQLWQVCEEQGLPRLVFLNKLDKERAGYQRNIDALRERYGKPMAPVHMPMGVEQDFGGVIDLLHFTAVAHRDGERVEEEVPEERREQAERNRTSLIEAIVEIDDELLMAYLEGETPDAKQLGECFGRGVRDCAFFPVLCGSATLGIGVQLLADFIVEECPSLDERRDVTGPTSALVFKTLSDPYVGHINLMRVMSGTLRADDTLEVARSGDKVRLHQLFSLQGAEQTPMPVAQAGDLVAVAKVDGLLTGDLLLAPGATLDVEVPRAPEGTHRVAIEADSSKDEDKLSTALHRLQEEDPALGVTHDDQTRQLVLTGNGPSHIAVAMARLERKFGVSVHEVPLRLRYLETITKTAQGLGRHVKQTGGAGQYGIAWVELSPLPRGAGFEFEDAIVGGVIPREYIPSVEKGVRAAMERGVLAGYPVVDVKCKLYDGKHHSTDSKPVAFEAAGSLAFRAAAEQAGMILLEPILDVRVTVPDSMTGDVMGDISARRGRIEGTHAAGVGRTEVRAKVPEAEMLTYTGDLRSITSGQGTVVMTYDHHAECPPNVAKKVIEAARAED